MLSLLAFKKSLFAGAPDGGDSEVFPGGTRLSMFMESVEAVSRTSNAEAPRAPCGEFEVQSSLATHPGIGHSLRLPQPVR
jgi:hypothetical protein